MIRRSHILGAVLTVSTACCHRSPPRADPRPDAAKSVQTGVASFYGREFAGRETASGDTLNLADMTAASRTLPLGTHVQVVNAENGRSARVTINDRGPYAKNRVIDVTPKAARRIGIDRDKGVALVRVRPIAPDDAGKDRSIH